MVKRKLSSKQMAAIARDRGETIPASPVVVEAKYARVVLETRGNIADTNDRCDASEPRGG